MSEIKNSSSKSQASSPHKHRHHSHNHKRNSHSHQNHHQHHSADRYHNQHHHHQHHDVRSSMSDNDEDYRIHKPTCKNNKPRSNRCQTTRFKDDLNESIHDLHKRVRDISFEQEKISDRLQKNCETSKRYSSDYKSHQKPSNLKNVNSDEALVGDSSDMENRLEKRINLVYSKMKKERDTTTHTVSSEIKTMLEEFRQCSKEDLTTRQLNQSEQEKQKTLQELHQTKKRLVDLEDSKQSLSSQVLLLKDQLSKFEQEQQFQKQQKRFLNQEDTAMSCKCHIEIANLKAEIQGVARRSSSASGDNHHNSTSEIFRTIEKYERQKDMLSDTNQSLKLTLKDKELEAVQHLEEIKALRDKNQDVEKNNFRLQSDLDMLSSKFMNVNTEQDKYAEYMRSAQEQFNMSEQKREDLKQDAQETIRLWKNKVRKLEKSHDRYKTETDKLLDKSENYKSSQISLTAQLENKNQECQTLRDINSNLEEKSNLQDMEVAHLKNLCEELKMQSISLKSELNEDRNSSKSLEKKCFELQTEKNNLERQCTSEEAKSREVFQKINDIQNELELLRNERKEFESYIHKLENECQKLKANLDNVERAEQEAKSDLNNFSKQAIHNKETYEETLSKFNTQIQQSQYQLHKTRIDYEDKLRILQAQLTEEKSNCDIYQRREADYLNEINEAKTSKRRIEDNLTELQAKIDKLHRNDNEKTHVVLEYEDKFNKALCELTHQKNYFFNKETEYLKMLNSIDVDADLVISLLSNNSNEEYRPLLNLEESDKANYLYLLIKHKIHWFCKNVEILFQNEYKLQQNNIFLEHELDTLKKTCTSNLKNQSIFLKNLENQNCELLSERAIALRNMQLLEEYLASLTDAMKDHSCREIDRTHHLLAIDNIHSLHKNENLSVREKSEIYERFKSYRNTINEIKMQLDASSLRISGSKEQVSKTKLARSSTISSDCKNTRIRTVTKPKPFKV